MSIFDAIFQTLHDFIIYNGVFVYVPPLIIVLGALLAIREKTLLVDPRSGHIRISNRGWIALGVAIFGLLITFIFIVQVKNELDTTKITMMDASAELAEANKRLRQLDGRIIKKAPEKIREKIVERIIEKIVHKEVAQSPVPQPSKTEIKTITITKIPDLKTQVRKKYYVPLDVNQEWQAPDTIHGGEIVKFFGYNCDLVLRYKNVNKLIPGSAAYPAERILGDKSESISWTVLNTSSDLCHGKITIETVTDSE